jgi:HK97 family phage prohead protease
MKKDYITDIDASSERRFFVSTLELRANSDGSASRRIRGYAAVFNRDSENFGYFIERVLPGAFDEVLNDEVVALFNHDPNYPLSRSGKGLTFGVDETGLWYEFDAPNTSVGNDLLENVRTGVINKSSFAFTVKTDKWTEMDGKATLREIVKIKRLYDVSPVTYAGYPDTSVANRSFQTEVRRDAVGKLAIMKRKLTLQKHIINF